MIINRKRGPRMCDWSLWLQPTKQVGRLQCNNVWILVRMTSILNVSPFAVSSIHQITLFLPSVVTQLKHMICKTWCCLSFQWHHTPWWAALVPINPFPTPSMTVILIPVNITIPSFHVLCNLHSHTTLPVMLLPFPNEKVHTKLTLHASCYSCWHWLSLPSFQHSTPR